ncbi:HET-domain-containing protein [Colletotrichum somersetense]|nr:HET-domain-containing protein [Colletotrichum somersetense]
MACGTGVVSSYIQTLMKEMKPAEREKVRLMSADSSEAQLGIVQEKIAREGWLGSKVVQADIMVQCYRVIKPGGTLATSTWVTEGWVPNIRDAVASLGLPGQPPVSWPQSSMELTSLWGPGAWHSPTFVKSMFTAAGFVDVEVEIVTKWVPFSSADQWCTVYQAFMHGVVERFWTKEQKDKLKGELMPTIKAFLETNHLGFVRLSSPVSGYRIAVSSINPVSQDEFTNCPQESSTHCWGGVISPLLTTDTLDAFMNYISVAILPANFRDAITITRNIGVRYLWIDSLCILQDSKSDWEAESKNMGLVYRNLTVTISAMASNGGREGVLKSGDTIANRFTTATPPIYKDVGEEYSKAQEVTIYRMDPNEENVAAFDSTCPLTQRGWTLQER